MVSSRLTHRRQRVPLPYVCLSKKKWFPYNKRREGIPARIDCTIFLRNSTCPEPSITALVQFSLKNQGNTLIWYGQGQGDGVNADCIMRYDPITGLFFLSGNFNSNAGFTPPAAGQFSEASLPAAVADLTVIEFSRLIAVGDFTVLIVSVSYKTDYGNKKG